MGNGTPCDLSNNKPRSTTVIFVCHPSSRNEVSVRLETNKLKPLSYYFI